MSSWSRKTNFVRCRCIGPSELSWLRETDTKISRRGFLEIMDKLDKVRGIGVGGLELPSDIGARVQQMVREGLRFGTGQVSSSDGQRFYLGGEGETGGTVNARYGRDPIIKLYTHISDRYAPFHVKVITGTSGEAIHVLDGLVNHDSAIDILAHHTDGGGGRRLTACKLQEQQRGFYAATGCGIAGFCQFHGSSSCSCRTG
jgi:hypothetical protein